MEVQTQTQPSSDFDLQSKPPLSFSLNDMEFHSSETRSSCMLDSDSTVGQHSATNDHHICEEFRKMPTACFTTSSPAIYPKAGKLTESDVMASLSKQSESDAVVKLQKVYRSYRTRRRLADSAIVAEELWWQAIDYARLNRSTISYFWKPETVTSRWNRISLNASKVGKGLSKDAKAQKLAFQHWIEAIDPRHRYGHNLHLYYEEWCKTDAGQPFFYWMDIGDGKDLDVKDCPRSKLRTQCIKYLGPQEREYYEYVVIEGKIIHKQTGDLLDTKNGSQAAKYIFVMSTSKKLYVGEKKKGRFHHSSFLAGGTTLAAGRLKAEHGTLRSISAYSGHYRPTDDRLVVFLSILKENGVNLNEVQINKANEDSDSYDEGKVSAVGTTTEVQTSEVEIPDEMEKISLSESTKPPQTKNKSEYKRTLSGGLQSPRAQVPKSKILQRINSKEAAKSFQLGHQLSLKWTTGAGPRIGCVADYPEEVRSQALEFVNLSPRTPRTPPSFRQISGPASPTSYSTTGINNGGINCNAG